MRVSRRPRQYLAETSNASIGDLAARKSRTAAKLASASSLATSSSLRPALVAPSRAWVIWLFSSSVAVCAALLICSKPSVALRTPIWANSRACSLAALVVSVACSITLSSGVAVVVMVGPLMRLGTGGCVLTGRICDHYGALQYKFVQCEKKRQLSLFFN